MEEVWQGGGSVNWCCSRALSLNPKHKGLVAFKSENTQFLNENVVLKTQGGRSVTEACMPAEPTHWHHTAGRSSPHGHWDVTTLPPEGPSSDPTPPQPCQGHPDLLEPVARATFKDTQLLISQVSPGTKSRAQGDSWSSGLGFAPAGQLRREGDPVGFSLHPDVDS